MVLLYICPSNHARADTRDRDCVPAPASLAPAPARATGARGFPIALATGSALSAGGVAERLRRLARRIEQLIPGSSMAEQLAQ